MIANDVQINSHPFYSGEHGKLERALLLKLTDLLDWDTTVGITSLLPKTPNVSIGIVDTMKIIPGQLPFFTQSVDIRLSSKYNPVCFPSRFDEKFYENVLSPLLVNWIAFTEIVFEFMDEEHISKKYMMRNIDHWKRYPISNYQALYFNPHNH